MSSRKSGLPFGANVVHMGYATPEQVEKALQVQRDRRARGKRHAMLGVLMTKMGFITPEQMLRVLSQTNDSEYRLSEDAIPLAVRIKASLFEDDNVVMVTGVGDEDGVNTIAYQVALAMALMEDGQGLLVDANYRAPTINTHIQHRLREQSEGDRTVLGLSEVVGRQASLEEAIHQSQVPNLALLPTGNTAVDFLSLMLSEEFGQLIETLSSRFRSVIIDAPPILNYPDTSMIASRTDGVVLVLSRGKGTKGEVIEVKRTLESLKIPLLGIVMRE